MTENEKKFAFAVGVMFLVILWLLFRDTKPARQLAQAIKDAFQLPSVDLSLPDIPGRDRPMPNLKTGKDRTNSCSLCMTENKTNVPAGIPKTYSRLDIGIGATQSAIDQTRWNNLSGNPPQYFPAY